MILIQAVLRTVYHRKRLSVNICFCLISKSILFLHISYVEFHTYHTKIFVLKEILYQYLPEKLFDRPKQGFSIPLQKWLRNELHYLIDEYLSEAKVKEFGLFNWKEVKSLKDRFDAGDTLYYNRIWALLVVQMWRSKNS